MSLQTPTDDTGQQVPVLRTALFQDLSVTAAAAQSAAFATTTKAVRISTTTDCFFLFGSNPTVAGGSTGDFLPSGTVEYRYVTGGHKLSVIRKSADGNLYISEIF